MARTAALLAGGLMLPGALGVMNAGGVPYTISNPAPEGHFSTEFADESPEFFDVYAEVKTRYSQVYWTRSQPAAAQGHRGSIRGQGHGHHGLRG